MAHTIKLGLLGNNLSRSRAKKLHELLGELDGLTVTYFSKIALFMPIC